MLSLEKELQLYVRFLLKNVTMALHHCSMIISLAKLVKQTGFRPVGREDVEGWRLLACLESLLQWDGQRLAVKQLLVLNSGTPESLPHGDVLKRH